LRWASYKNADDCLYEKCWQVERFENENEDNRVKELRCVLSKRSARLFVDELLCGLCIHPPFANIE